MVDCESCRRTKRYMVAAAHAALADRGVEVSHGIAEGVVDAIVATTQLPMHHPD